MSRITRSALARANVVVEVPASAPAVPEPLPAIPIVPIVPEAAPAVPATNIEAAEDKCEWLVSINVAGADDDIEIRHGKGQLYIFENYIDKDNNKRTSGTQVTPTLLKSWLKLWFKSLRMDTHPKWTSVNLYFSLMPAIATPRADLSKNRAYDLIDHIRDAVDFHLALANINM